MITDNKKLLERAIGLELHRRLSERYSESDSQEEKQIEFVRVVEPDDEKFLEYAVDLYIQSVICGGPLKIPRRVESYSEAHEGEISIDCRLVRRIPE